MRRMPGRELVQHFERAALAYDEGRYDEAVAAFDEALVIARPRRRFAQAVPDLLHSRGGALLASGRFAEGESSVREAIAVRRGLAKRLPAEQVARLSDSLELLATMLTEDRRLEEADALLREVVALRGDGTWEDRARGLLNRSAALLAAGRDEEGLAVALELVQGERAQMIVAGADQTFVEGLGNLAVLLRRNGHWEQAVAVQRMAVEQLRPLAGAGDATLRSDLASALSNHSVMHLERGRHEEALEPGAEALAIREELAEHAPVLYTADLTDSLNNQAAILHELGRHEEAEHLAGRCVALRRALHADRPRPFERRLANALATHAEVLTACGRGDEAVGPAGEAVERLDALESAEQGQHLPWLASALDTLAGALSATGQVGPALDASGRACDVARAAYDDLPRAAGLPMAQVLIACAKRHAGDDPDRARRWANEAVGMLRALSEDEPAAHAQPLARALEVRARLD